MIKQSTPTATLPARLLPEDHIKITGAGEIRFTRAGRKLSGEKAADDLTEILRPFIRKLDRAYMNTLANLIADAVGCSTGEPIGCTDGMTFPLYPRTPLSHQNQPTRLQAGDEAYVDNREIILRRDGIRMLRNGRPNFYRLPFGSHAVLHALLRFLAHLVHLSTVEDLPGPPPFFRFKE